MAKDDYSLFRKKYITLRDLYGLDNKLVTQYCNLFYNDSLAKGELTFWANGRRKPTVDGIFTLSAFFVVSCFWFGVKDYVENSSDYRVYSLLQVESIEENLLEQYTDLVKEFTCEEYLEEKFRAEYSKEARANILVLLQILIGEKKLYPNNKATVHTTRVENAKKDIKAVLETKSPVKIIPEIK